MKRTTIATATVLLFAACSASHPNMRYVRTTGDNLRAFVVIDQRHSSTLGFVDARNRLHLILPPLDVLAKVSQLWVSPDQKQVVIESYGEGHQFISVYDIAVLVRDDDRDSPVIPPVATLDPYPSAFWAMRWSDAGRIEFCAKSDFTTFDTQTRRGRYADDDHIDVARRWRWHLGNDTFEETRSQPCGPSDRTP